MFPNAPFSDIRLIFWVSIGGQTGEYHYGKDETSRQLVTPVLPCKSPEVESKEKGPPIRAGLY